MKILRAFCLLLPFALAGCGIPSAIATGIKAAEKAHDEAKAKKDAEAQGNGAQPTQAAQPVKTTSEQPVDDTPILVSPPPARASVTTEKLQ